jgi:hypothetical protein
MKLAGEQLRMKLAGEQLRMKLRMKLAGVRQMMICWPEEELHWRTLSRLRDGYCCWVALAGWSEP